MFRIGGAYSLMDMVNFQRKQAILPNHVGVWESLGYVLKNCAPHALVACQRYSRIEFPYKGIERSTLS